MKKHLKKLNAGLKDFIQSYGMIFGLVFSIAALGLGGYNTYLLKNGTRNALPQTKKIDKLTRTEVEKIIKSGAQVLGNADAKVTVVEFADFQCPYCAKYHTEVFPEIKKYIDAGKVKFVFMNFAVLGEESLFAAEAVKCASEQNKFLEYYDYLYKNQQGRNQGGFGFDTLKEHAQKIGLDNTAFSSCLDTRKYKGAVETETQTGKRFGVTGTPGTFIDSFYISGLQGVSYFINRIDAYLSGK